VILYEAELNPFELMALLLKIEAVLGRVRQERWGPRVIDLDLLFWDDTVLESDFLTLPHPRLSERGFVLNPLVEVAPDWVHPKLRLSASALLEKLPADGSKLIKLG
jgi:2-amino-4-hydroxy-6-hydroxymethyldihydropteridine diphosphokinase